MGTVLERENTSTEAEASLMVDKVGNGRRRKRRRKRRKRRGEEEEEGGREGRGGGRGR